jgi:hypothetical protein
LSDYATNNTGYYIHTCLKMQYKARYKPSQVLDPISYNWHPFTEFESEWEHGKQFVSLDGQKVSAMPGMWKESDITHLIPVATVTEDHELCTFRESTLYTNPNAIRQIRETVQAVGPELAAHLVIVLT